MTARPISSRWPGHGPGLAFRALAWAALLAEVLLVWSKMDGPSANRWLVPFLLLPLGIPLLLWKINFPGWLHMGAAAGTVGGLAMLIGDLLNHTPTETICGCALPAGPNPGSRAPFAWPDGLMPLACLVSSRMICPATSETSGCARPSAGAAWMKHLGCLGGMWLGMILGGRWLAPAFAEFLGVPAGIRLAMVAGMAIGAGFGHWLFWQTPRLIIHDRPRPGPVSQVMAN